MINISFKLRILFVLIAISSTLSASQDYCSEPGQKIVSWLCPQPLFEVKAGYFFFSNSKMRKVYDKGGLDIQLCSSYPLWNLASGWSFQAYGAVEYFHQSGKSMNDHQKTSLWSVPVNIGLKSVYAINANIQYYFGVGPRYFYIHQHNRSSYVYKNRSQNGLGCFVNTGFNYILCNHFVIDIFGEYSYAKMRLHGGNSCVYTRNIQVGGFTFGGGLGYVF